MVILLYLLADMADWISETEMVQSTFIQKRYAKDKNLNI